RLAFLTGLIGISMDVPPFCVVGARNTLFGLNLVGLRRNGVPRDHIVLLRKAFRSALRSKLPRKEMLAILQDLGKDCPPTMEMADFAASAKRPICPGTRGPAIPDDEDDSDI